MELDLTKMNNINQVSNNVYDTLKDNILRLNLKPGDRMSEQEIAKILEVSRTPVREALINLSKEGLINILPQRSTYISKIDFNQVEEIRFIRESLELSVIEIVAVVISQEAIFELEKNILNQKEALLNNSYDQMMMYDQQFHKKIFETANKNHTWQIIEQISSHYRMARILSLAGNISWELAITQHEELIKAFKNHDVKTATLVSRNHLRNIKFDKDALKEKFPKYFI